MSSAGALRSMVVRAVAAPSKPPDDLPETRNALLWPIGPLPKNPKELRPLVPSVLNDLEVIEYEDVGSPRVCVYLGLGSTLRGLGRALAGIFSGMSGDSTQ